jgi:hypothetical protein
MRIPFTAIFGVLAFLFTLTSAQASPQNDRVYQLDTLSWLKAADNVDGIFADYLDDLYTRYFKRQSRFAVKPLVGLDAVIGKTSLTYNEIINNKDVIKKIAQKYRAESLIRTHVFKEGETYRFVLEWVYAPKGDVLSSVEFRYVDPKKSQGLEGSDLPVAIEQGLDQLISKLPFIGQVTGVEGDTITVNLGRNQNIRPREIFTIYTLQSLKRHPILNTIEEWRWEPVGRASVEQVEESISFAKVIETEPNQKVIQYQKIKEVLPAPAEKQPEEAKVEKPFPRLGWVAANIGIGNYSRDVGLPTAAGRTGGGLLGDAEIEGLLWLNSRWLTEASLMTGFTKYSPSDLSTGMSTGTSYSGSTTQARVAVGYSLFPARTIFDAIGWVHAGYRYTGYSLPAQATDYTGNSSVGSFFVGVGGEIPLDSRFAAQLGLDLGLIRSASQDSPDFGATSGSSDLMLSVGGTYHLQDQFFLRLLVKLNSESMDFAGGQSVSQKLFSVSPSIMYYF